MTFVSVGVFGVELLETYANQDVQQPTGYPKELHSNAVARQLHLCCGMNNQQDSQSICAEKLNNQLS